MQLQSKYNLYGFICHLKCVWENLPNDEGQTLYCNHKLKDNTYLKQKNNNIQLDFYRKTKKQYYIIMYNLVNSFGST